MALPPEPIDEVLPSAQVGVIAKVTKILHRDKQADIPNVTEGEADLPRELPMQLIEMCIEEVLFGSAYSQGSTMQAKKPAGDYTLREGVGGGFLLTTAKDASIPEILGRYGPDTWSLKVLRAAIAKHQRT